MNIESHEMDLTVKLISTGLLLILFFTILKFYYPYIGYVGLLLSHLIMFIAIVVGMVSAFRNIKKKTMDKNK